MKMQLLCWQKSNENEDNVVDKNSDIKNKQVIKNHSQAGPML